MTGVTRSGQNPVNYVYDASGRLIRRIDNPLGAPSTTVNYWLGLNRLATEKLVTPSATNAQAYKPDPETASTPQGDGWNQVSYAPSGSNLAYGTDAERGKALHIWYTGSGDWYSKVIIGDSASVDWNPIGTTWGKTGRTVMSLWMKSTWGYQYYVLARVKSPSGTVSTRYFYFYPGTGSAYHSGNYDYFPQDASYTTSQWVYMEKDLGALLNSVESGYTIQDIDGFLVYGVDLWLDDVTFSSGVCERSYAEVPGAAIGGVLGSQTGPNVVADNGNRVRYFQYNDLGTVLVQTKADDSLEGLWLPDFFGNYSYPIAGDLPRASGSPTRPELGLTGKMYDTAAGLYYFNARWYDPERGRFISRDPVQRSIGPDYLIGTDNVVNKLDSTGYMSQCASCAFKKFGACFSATGAATNFGFADPAFLGCLALGPGAPECIATVAAASGLILAGGAALCAASAEASYRKCLRNQPIPGGEDESPAQCAQDCSRFLGTGHFASCYKGCLRANTNQSRGE